MIVDPAMIRWNPNPEMFPNQPVGLPMRTQAVPDPNGYAEIFSDPVWAFQQGAPATNNTPPEVFIDPVHAFQQTGPVITSQPPPAATQQFQAPSYGPMQNLALQMAGYGAPSGVRSSSQMAVTPFSSGGGGGYDGSDTTPNSDRNPAANPADNLLYNGGGVIGVGGGNSLPTNQGWINNILDNASGYFPPGATIDISNPFAGGNIGDALTAGGGALLATGNPLVAVGSGLYNLFQSAQNSQTPSGPFTPDTRPTEIEEVFGVPPQPSTPNAAPTGPQTTAYTGNVYRRPIPITRRSRPGHLGEDSGR